MVQMVTQEGAEREITGPERWEDKQPLHLSAGSLRPRCLHGQAGPTPSLTLSANFFLFFASGRIPAGQYLLSLLFLS